MIVKPTVPINQVLIDQEQAYIQNARKISLSDEKFIFSSMNMLPLKNASSMISPQMDITHEEGTKYEKLNGLLQLRQKQVIELSNLIGSQNSKMNINNILISGICQTLSEMRDNSLEIAQLIIALNRQHTINQGSSSLQCKRLLLELSTQIGLLKDSFMNRFIMLQYSYDPFLLYHYERRHNKGRLFNHPAVDKLFNLNISYASRIIRANKSIQNLLNQSSNETKTFKRKSKSLVPEKKISFIANQKMENDSRRTKSNFKVRTRLMNKIKEASKLTNIQSSENSLPYQNESRYNPGNNGDQTPFAEQAAPIKFRKNTVLPKTHFLHNLKKKSSFQNQKLIFSSSRYFGFKQNLSPIANQSQREINKSLSEQNEVQSPQRFNQEFNVITPQNSEQKSDLKSTNESQKQQLKMRSKKLNLAQLIQYIKSLSIPQQLKNETTNQSQFPLSQHQSYLSEFFMNKQLKAIGISLVLPNGDYLIKLWSPLANCSTQLNRHIFCKYLEYLQKQTQCNAIYYKGSFKQLVLSLQFVAKSEKLFFRPRLLLKSQRQYQFAQFLSLKCSNILFPQQNQSINMLYSDEIQSFSQNNYYIQPQLAQINTDRIHPNLLLASKLSKDIADMKALNCLLQDQQFDTYEVTSAMKISNISAFRIAQNLQFKSPFIAGQGYFKFDGEEIFRKDDSLICKVETSQQNCCILFGKGFSNIECFVNKCKKKGKKACQFSVKMFNKQLYGRMINNSINLCSYANWEFSFSWKDQIQGRVKHNMTVCETFGSQPFYFAIEMQSQIIFCFQVKDSDHLF